MQVKKEVKHFTALTIYGMLHLQKLAKKLISKNKKLGLSSISSPIQSLLLEWRQNYLLEVRNSLGEASLLLTFADFLLSFLWPFLEAEVVESLDDVFTEFSLSPSPAVRWM